MKKTKYQFIETIGCVSFNFTVNKKTVTELSKQEYNEMLELLFTTIKENINRTILLEDIVRLLPHESCEHDPYVCEQCGDTVTTTTWVI